MKEELLSGTLIAADETDIQVLKEKDRLPSAMSKMWVYRSISRSVDRDGPPPIIIFEYQSGRSGEYAKNFLRGFKGFLMSDAYQGYNAVPDVTHCYCWSHMRRYWHRALPRNSNGSKARASGESPVDFRAGSGSSLLRGQVQNGGCTKND